MLELTGALVQRTPPTVVGPLSPEEAASELLAYLRRWGYVPADVSADYELAADRAYTEPKKPATIHETGIKR
jgi:electron transfer flavoprotein beta subunit